MLDYGKWFVELIFKKWYTGLSVYTLGRSNLKLGLLTSDSLVLGSVSTKLDIYLIFIHVNLTVGKHETVSSN